ncbi:hypothetical protein F5890DRAFT_907151 [Lentinula detonsa]|uniref:Uncharacterized protein n=1 Tax=Lentinula detonsa TaxID=2804962 RepID=A0AA38Q3Y7_9AGAR|nr:hypothetical protein F5890DRAFT_907151 [Lentinula detonsa]
MLLGQLYDLHLLVRALLLQRVHLSPQSVHLDLQIIDLILVHTKFGVLLALALQQIFHLFRSFTITFSSCLKCPLLFTYHSSVLPIDVAQAFTEAFNFLFQVCDPSRVFPDIAIALFNVRLEARNFVERVLAFHFEFGDASLVFLHGLSYSFSMFVFVANLVFRLQREKK